MGQSAAQETSPRGAGLRPVLLDLRMPFSPEAGQDGSEGMIDLRTTDPHAYVEALSREVLAAAPDYADCQVQAVALTGGMAAHVADDALAALLRDLRRRFNMAPGAEVSLRVRPGMVSAASMDMMRIGHVSRAVVDYATSSLKEWRALGRMLDPAAMDVTRMVLGPKGASGLGASLAGRELDLAFELLWAIPGQTRATAAASVEAALAYGATEVRLKACASFSDTRPAANDVLDAMCERLGAAGFAEYLPGRWALPGHECRWEILAAQGSTEVLGFGLGARTSFEGILARNTSDIGTYLRFSDDPEKCVAEVTRRA